MLFVGLVVMATMWKMLNASLKKLLPIWIVRANPCCLSLILIAGSSIVDNWDDHLGYRKYNELKHWMDLCPLNRIHKQLIAGGETSEALDAIGKEMDERIENAFAFARSSTFPDVNELYEHIYAE